MFNALSRRRGLFAAAACALAALGLSAGASRAHEYKLGALEILHPWSRATPGGSKVAAGFFEVKNAGAAPDRLIAATSTLSAKTEIHETEMKDGVMTMRPVTGGLVIPAHGSATLKPGSYHVMFVDIKEPLKEGMVVDGTLTFEKAGTVSVQYHVEGVGAAQSGHMEQGGHMDHMDMKP
ncbi:copper chaperone PCu(A)C [Methylocella sp.]|uniref:copper chaperone PCu(A)C n=1 Tax=Methylocella sp. TaxID=1978226 RepID=UPI003784AB4C